MNSRFSPLSFRLRTARGATWLCLLSTPLVQQAMGQAYFREISATDVAAPAVAIETLPKPETAQRDFPMADPMSEPHDSFIGSLKGNDSAIKIVAGQGRLLTLKRRISTKDRAGSIAVGDPSILDFQVLPNSQFIRLLGLRPGVTDLSITTGDDATHSFEVHVVYDLDLLQAGLRQTFPDASVRLAQLREHLVVEGQARTSAQTTQIISLLEAYLESMQAQVEQQGRSNDNQFPLVNPTPSTAAAVPDDTDVAASDPSEGNANSNPNDNQPRLPLRSTLELGGLQQARAQAPRGRVINLIQVPGVQQVLLQVRIAELNRTAIREVGADILGVDPDTGNMLGTRIGGSSVSASGMASLGGLLGTSNGNLGNNSTAFGIFPSGDFQVIFRALRQNGFLRVLAEPNLIAMSGHRANFLAGGEFPVPVPQATGTTNNAVTVDFREFGVRLDFLPYVIDEDRIRLSVTPEVSTIDFTLGTTLVVGGSPVPGLNTRRANTTVELRPGQTLAMAGLLQVELDGQTARIPGLGDLPYIGPFFSNTTHRRVEKELVVLVTPQLVLPLDEQEGFPLPGDEIEDPTNHEFYFDNQPEGRSGMQYRATSPLPSSRSHRLMRHEQRLLRGPIGFSE